MFDPEVLQILGLNLMSQRSPNFGEALGNAGLATMQYQRQREEDKYRKEEREFLKQQREMQMAQMKREQQFRDALGQAVRPGIAADPLTPMDDEGNRMPSSRPSMDFSQAMAIDPLAALQAQAQFAKMNEPRAPISVKEGEVLLDPQTRQPIYQNRKPQEQWSFMSPAEAQQMGLPPGIGYQRNAATGRIDAFGSRAPVTNVTTNVNGSKEIFKDSFMLKKDYDSQPEIKQYKEVRQAWDQISTALANPSGANDLVAATKFMKILDPGSVVRESELGMAMAATGALDRFLNYGEQLKSGQKLTPSQRQDFFAAGKALHDAAKSRVDQTADHYVGIAQRYGLDPSFIYRGDAKLIKNTTKLVEARDAIKKGVPRNDVIKRLVEAGYDPEGL